MKLLKTRKARKELKELLHHAKHVRHMHEDIADPKLIEELVAGEDAARVVRKSGGLELMQRAGEALEKVCLKVAPPRKNPKTREWVEVLFVALGAAMAIRAYFFQPFKIPTGSMQPTLYGITIRTPEPTESDFFPVRMAKLFSKGELFVQHDSPIERIAKTLMLGKPYTTRSAGTGYIQTKQMQDGSVQAAVYRDNFNNHNVIIHIGGTPQSIPGGFLQYCRFGEQLKKGEPLFKGIVKAGDYILVNRLKYNFIRPKRGDITVFDTRGLTHPGVRPDSYYIKRMVGLPGETLSVAPPYLLVNGKKPTNPRFDKIFNDTSYDGYTLGDSRSIPLIEKLGDSILLDQDEYLFFGDNTENSLDGRYFGAVNRKRILGSAFFVCMPFDRAGFAETSH